MSVLNRRLYKSIHRINAMVLSTFILIHLSVNLSAWAGVDVHQTSQSTTRIVYQSIWFEPILVLCVLFQASTGIGLVLKRRRIDRVTLSGLYLASFMIIHASAALSARFFSNIDTNYFWAAGSLTYGWLGLIFALYYALAIISLFVHLQAAFVRGWPLGFRFRKARPQYAIGSGIIFAVLLLLPYSPMLRDDPLPKEIEAYFYTNFGWTGQVRPEAVHP